VSSQSPFPVPQLCVQTPYVCGYHGSLHIAVFSVNMLAIGRHCLFVVEQTLPSAQHEPRQQLPSTEYSLLFGAACVILHAMPSASEPSGREHCPNGACMMPPLGSTVSRRVHKPGASAAHSPSAPVGSCRHVPQTKDTTLVFGGTIRLYHSPILRKHLS